MKTLFNDNSAAERGETPHATNSTQNKTSNRKQTISAAVKRRAESLIKDKSIGELSRAVIRYGLEGNDAWLPELVRRVEAGESISEALKALAETTDN